MTKIKNIDEIVRFCEQKKQVGDYQTLAKVLNTSVDSVRMRYKRRDENTVRAMYRIIEQRENLIKEFQE